MSVRCWQHCIVTHLYSHLSLYLDRNLFKSMSTDSLGLCIRCFLNLLKLQSQVGLKRLIQKTLQTDRYLTQEWVYQCTFCSICRLCSSDILNRFITSSKWKKNCSRSFADLFHYYNQSWNLLHFDSCHKLYKIC